MRNNGNLLQQAVSELVDQVPMDTAAHLSADDLAAYHEGRLSGDEDARLADHLVGCTECTSLLLDLERFQVDDPSDVATSEFELAAAWRGLSPRLKAEEQGAEKPQVEEMQPRSPIPSRRFSSGLSLLAASLVAAVVGLSAWVHALRGSLEELERPHVNTPVVDLLTGNQRGGDPSFEDPLLARDKVLKLAPGHQFYTLILHPPWEKGRDEYRIEVSRPDGETTWSETGLRKNSVRSLSLTVPRRLLTPGRHRIRLFHADAQGGDPAAEFWLRVEP